LDRTQLHGAFGFLVAIREEGYELRYLGIFFPIDADRISDASKLCRLAYAPHTVGLRGVGKAGSEVDHPSSKTSAAARRALAKVVQRYVTP
jgi:hypothetical protein